MRQKVNVSVWIVEQNTKGQNAEGDSKRQRTDKRQTSEIQNSDDTNSREFGGGAKRGLGKVHMPLAGSSEEQKSGEVR